MCYVDDLMSVCVIRYEGEQRLEVIIKGSYMFNPLQIVFFVSVDVFP